MHEDAEKTVAVITGAASGLGLALAKLCGSRNMRLVMVDKNLQALESSARDLEACDILPLAADVSHQEEVIAVAEKCMQTFGRVDWLFNNAGISGPIAPFWQLEAQKLKDTMDVNLFGVIHGIQAFLPFMFAQKHRSHIINMASFYALCSGSQLAAYTMSKHAILALSESLYFDLQRFDKPVDVSVVCPSFVNTGLLSSDKKLRNEAFHAVLANLLERSREAEDVAKHIVSALLAKVFYILPDQEVKEYCLKRAEAINRQEKPHEHAMEKLLGALYQRTLSL